MPTNSSTATARRLFYCFLGSSTIFVRESSCAEGWRSPLSLLFFFIRQGFRAKDGHEHVKL
jgi:hypothetical protein